MANPVDQPSQSSIVQVRIGLDEFSWLHELFKSSRNFSPRFRLPDLLSACIALALDGGERLVVAHLHRQLAHRVSNTDRRTCHVFTAQFALLQRAHRAPWNSSPNPLFELELVATACVGVVQLFPNAADSVLAKARNNLADRALVDVPRVLAN